MEAKEIKVIREEPVYEFYGCCSEFGEHIVLYAKDVREADIGHVWSCEDQDCYPNRTKEWQHSIRKVYEDSLGILLIEHDEDSEETNTYWFEK